MGRPQAPCGTQSAYRRHLRNDEPPCDACRVAHREGRRAERGSAAPDLGVEPVAPGPDVDPLVFARDQLVNAIGIVSVSDPSRLAPLVGELRKVVAEMGGIQERPKSLAEQLADARARRAAGS